MTLAGSFEGTGGTSTSPAPRLPRRVLPEPVRRDVPPGVGPPETLLVLPDRGLGSGNVAGSGEQQLLGPLVDPGEMLVLGEADGEGLGVVGVEAASQLVAGVQRVLHRTQGQRGFVPQRCRLLVEL